MDEVVTSGGTSYQIDQILYNLMRRGPEHDLIPWLVRHHMPVMAYSPVEQGRLIAHPDLARERDATPAQLALAWLLEQDGVLPIPKAGSVTHVRENHAALDLALTQDEMRHLDALFPPPRGPEPLAML